MATGYMTLPLPVIGNSRYLVSPNTSTNSTLNEGPTPAPYWAVLWNRALKIIDNHHHWAANSYSGGTTGKQLKWGGSNNGIRICKDLNLENKILYGTLGLGYPANILNLKFLGISQKTNIYEPIGDFDVNEDLHSEMDGRFPINNTFHQRWSIYGRLSYNRASFSDGYKGIFGGTTNFNYQPSRDLIWNNGGADKEGTVIIDNCPGGPIRGQFGSLLFAPFNVTGLPNNEDYAEPYISQKWNTNAPFVALLDNQKEGIYSQAYSYLAINTVTAHENAGYGWMQDDVSSTGTGLVILECNEELSIDWYNDPRIATILTTNGGSGIDDVPVRMGKYMWVTDYWGDASTYNIEITCEDTSPLSQHATLRWYDSGSGTHKSSTAPSGPDTLYLDTDFESVLLVRANVKLWFAYFK
jgi:hypothetical protein